MRPSLRRRGASFLGEMPRGAHLCMFYESTDDLLDSLVPFFQIGLENNEFCSWTPPGQPTLEEFRIALGWRIPNFDQQLAAGNIVVLSREIYFKGDQVDHLGLMSDLANKFRDALAKGYKGMRASGDALWTDTGQWRDFCNYEYKLSQWLKGKPVALLCTYPMIMSEAVEVSEAVGAHQLAVARQNGSWKLAETTPTTARNDSPTPKIGFTGKLLSEREQNIINLMAQGNSDKEIARSLAISPETVKTYVRRIFVKLNVYKRTRAVALAQSLGIVNTY